MQKLNGLNGSANQATTQCRNEKVFVQLFILQMACSLQAPAVKAPACKTTCISVVCNYAASQQQLQRFAFDFLTSSYSDLASLVVELAPPDHNLFLCNLRLFFKRKVCWRLEHA
jgi:hypothetical protein